MDFIAVIIKSKEEKKGISFSGLLCNGILLNVALETIHTFLNSLVPGTPIGLAPEGYLHPLTEDKDDQRSEKVRYILQEDWVLWDSEDDTGSLELAIALAHEDDELPF